VKKIEKREKLGGKMYLPDSILQETNLNHEEITSGY
jgi:hypothetical protein